MCRGPEIALPMVEELAASARLDGYHLLPTVEADLLRRLGRFAEAADRLEKALELTTNPTDRDLLRTRLDETRAKIERPDDPPSR